MFVLIWVWIGFLGYWNGLRADLGGFFGCLGWCVVCFFGFFGEFDPGSGRTLAACLTHASRTGPHLFWGRVEWRTGEYHVSNLPSSPG